MIKSHLQSNTLVHTFCETKHNFESYQQATLLKGYIISITFCNFIRNFERQQQATLLKSYCWNLLFYRQRAVSRTATLLRVE